MRNARVLRLNGFKAFRLERKQRRDPRDTPTIGPFVPRHGRSGGATLGESEVSFSARVGAFV
jgi:hypothetical protein